MEEIHFHLRCIVCYMVAVFPLKFKQQPPWFKCDNFHTSSIYSVAPGRAKQVLSVHLLLLSKVLVLCLCHLTSRWGDCHCAQTVARSNGRKRTVQSDTLDKAGSIPITGIL